MPLPIVAQIYDYVDSSSTTFRFCVAAIVLFFTLRVWSATPTLRVRRVLHGRTVLISGGLSSLNLSLIRSLATQGAQIILLHKDPSDPMLQQFLDLLRSTTENERIYAESCDTSACTTESLESIVAFTSKWQSMLKKSPLGDDLGPEPIDTLILSDDECLEKKHGFGTSKDASVQYYNASLKSKIALTQGLLPTLRKSKTRVVNVVSPFYAASPPLEIPPPAANAAATATTTASVPPAFISKTSWRSFQPWTFASPASLCSIAAFKHLASSEAGGGGPSGIDFDNLPASIVDAGVREQKMTIVSVSPGLTRSWLLDMFTSNTPYLGWPLVLLLSPLIYAAGKSMTNATKEVERAIHGDFLDLEKHPKGVPSGSLVVGGRVVMVPRPEVSDPAFGEALWKYETSTLPKPKKASKKAK